MRMYYHLRLRQTECDWKLDDWRLDDGRLTTGGWRPADAAGRLAADDALDSFEGHLLAGFIRYFNLFIVFFFYLVGC